MVNPQMYNGSNFMVIYGSKRVWYQELKLQKDIPAAGDFVASNYHGFMFIAGFFVSSLILPWVFTPASFLNNWTQGLEMRLRRPWKQGCKSLAYNGNEIGLSKGKIVF